MPRRNAINSRPIVKSSSTVRETETNVASFNYDPEFLEAAVKRISFWRVFPFHMCEHYLGIKLKPFQKKILFEMFNNANSVYIASRSQGELSLVYDKVVVSYTVNKENRRSLNQKWHDNIERAIANSLCNA